MALSVREVTGEGLTLFRVTKSGDREDPAFLDSFKSNYELGGPPRGIEHRFAVVHMGLSMFDSLEGAVRTARLPRVWPKIGEWVAEVRLVAGLGVGYTDETGQPGHLTVWGRPAQLRSSVVDIVAIDPPL